MPPAKAMLADRGYASNWFRNALITKCTAPCISSEANRKVPIRHDQIFDRQRHRIETMFGKL